MPDAGHPEPSPQADRDRRWWPSQALARLAATQDGVLALSQLRALGVPEGTRKHWLRNGRLTLVAPATYALGHQSLSERGWRSAGLLTAGEDAALAQLTALEHRNVARFRDRRVHVVVPRGSCRPRARFVVHRAALLDERDVEMIDGLRCTTVARALVDLAGSVPLGTLAYACRQAEYARQLDVRAIGLCLSRMNRQPGVDRLREVLAPAGINGAIAETRLEQRLLDALLRAGSPIPALQRRFDLRPDHRPARVDFWYPEAQLVVEADGPHHALPLQAALDAERDAAFARRGIPVIRVTDLELEGDPDAATARVMAALHRRWSP